MPDRRAFLRQVAGAGAGLFASSVGLAGVAARAGQIGAPPGKRREVSIGGRRIKTVDVHAHCFVAEVWDLVKDTNLAATAKANLTGPVALGNPQRLQDMDAQGIDYQAINVNAWGYSAERAWCATSSRFRTKRFRSGAPRIPTGSSGWRRWRCSTRSSRRSSWTRRSRSWASEAPRSAAAVKARSSPIGSSIRSGRRRRNSASCCSCILSRLPARRRTCGCKARAVWATPLKNPLETTVFLSHLIFEGTLDRFPGLRICGAHAGGYLASYSGRSDAFCGRGAGTADCKSLRKRPSEYFKRELFIDTMVFHADGLRHLVAEVGVGQIFYGTDYPFDWPVGVDFVLNAPFLSNAEKEAILGGNLITLLRIA